MSVDYKAHALGFMASAKMLISNVNNPMWLGKDFVVVRQSYITALEEHVTRLEEAVKGDVKEKYGVPLSIGYSPPPIDVQPPLHSTRIGNLERQVGNLEKRFGEIELTSTGVTRNLARVDRTLIRLEHNLDTLLSAIFPKKKAKKRKQSSVLDTAPRIQGVFDKKELKKPGKERT